MEELLEAEAQVRRTESEKAQDFARRLNAELEAALVSPATATESLICQVEMLLFCQEICR